VHLTQFYFLGHLCAKNYQSWWKFDEVLMKTILTVFLRHGVCMIITTACQHSTVVISSILTIQLEMKPGYYSFSRGSLRIYGLQYTLR